MKAKLYILVIFTITSSKFFSQNYTGRDTIGKKEAIVFVNESTKNIKHKRVANFDKKLITDKSTAVNIAETILFNVIGQQEIVKQQPYEIFFISDFWYIRGTTEKAEPGTKLGGAQFNIIIDSYDSKVVLLSQDE